MKNLRNLMILTIAILSLISCGGSCDCSENWSAEDLYIKDDVVSYEGKCWTAVAQGRGIVPGPWLENGNDIWEECVE